MRHFANATNRETPAETLNAVSVPESKIGERAKTMQKGKKKYGIKSSTGLLSLNRL